MEQLHTVYKHYNNNMFEEGKCILDEINPNMLKNKKGYYTLLLRYYYNTNNHDMINTMIMSVDTLMKRDYLEYCKYCYDNNIYCENAKKIFIEKIINTECLESDDIIFIRDNCNELLKTLDGYYIKINIDGNYDNINIMKKRNDMNQYNSIIMNFYQSKLSKSMLVKLNHILEGRDVIIDGGNVSYFGSKNTNPTYKYVDIIYKMAKKTFTNPLIILHERHMNNTQVFNKYKNNLFTTNFGTYDDYYIMYSMFKKNIPIITNDKFRDHIYDMMCLFEGKHSIVKGYINDMILHYNNHNVETSTKYSKCIQVINNDIYIPTISDSIYHYTVKN